MVRFAWSSALVSVFVVVVFVASCSPKPAPEQSALASVMTEKVATQSDWLPCVERPEHQAIWVDDCDRTHMCLDDGIAHYVECQPVAGGDIPPDPCPSLGHQACRQRDDCIVIHYRGPSDDEPLGPFAECFTEPRPGQCQADYECSSGRCSWNNKVCSHQMCWGECES